MRIVISSGHGKHVAGCSAYIEEVAEARRVVDRVAGHLGLSGVNVEVFHDDVSRTQAENLRRIVDFHNGEIRDLDVSVHFNAYEITDKAMGVEVLYVTQGMLAGKVSAAICKASGLKDRGGKKRSDLYFLNKTEEPAILIEVCFVDSSVDVDIYHEHFEDICRGISGAISGVDVEPAPEPPPAAFSVHGKVSSFGGPDDTGVSPTEGLAFISSIEQAPHLFLPYQAQGTTGLARRLNPYIHYVACRWDYSKTPKAVLREGVAMVRANGLALKAFPADWGPSETTARVADISPGLMDDLGIETDDEVEVTFPA